MDWIVDPAASFGEWRIDIHGCSGYGASMLKGLHLKAFLRRPFTINS